MLENPVAYEIALLTFSLNESFNPKAPKKTKLNLPDSKAFSNS
jgi:hypothetical protein